jgi:hypothetical protein
MLHTMVSRSTNRFGFFSSPLLVVSFLSAATVIGSIFVEALIPVAPLCVQQRPYQVSTRLSLQKGWLDNNDDENNANYNNNNNNNDNGKDDDDDDDGLVTREDVNRDLLGLEPIVKRKRKNGKQGGGGYRPLDNRDHLPFSVRTNTPEDPYKTKFLKERQKQEQNKINNEITNNKNKKTTSDLEHHMLPSTNRISPSNNKNKKNNRKQSDDTPSRLVQMRSNKDNAGKMSETVIGEYQLDKSTTSGDVIVIGEKEYQVQQARCQYKYAGGQRFVMVRKILEVKEVNRVQNEEALLRQYKKSSSSILPEGSLD